MLCIGLDGAKCTSVSWPQTSWYPPIHGCINVNVDDVVDHSKEHIGISVVACVEHGFVIAAATKRMIGRFSPHLDKCVAVREGVWLALVLGFSEWTVETDAINVFLATQSPVSMVMDANIINYIIDGCVGPRGGSVCYVPRTGNSVTHFLTRYVICSSVSFVWLDVLPKLLGSVYAQSVSK